MPKIKKSNYHCFDLSRLNDDSIIVDAGACEGSTVEGLRSHPETSKCKIFLIEPNKTNIKKLHKADFGDSKIIELALCGESVPAEMEFIEYYSKRGSYRGWGNIEKGYWDKFSGTYIVKILKYKVKTIKMNRLFGLTGDRIDYLKMDIEGSEKNLFDTISLKSLSMIDQLSFELHKRQWLPSIQEKLEVNGFKVFDMPKKAEVYATKDQTVRMKDLPYG